MRKIYLFVLTVMAAGAVNAQLFKTNEMAAGAKKLALTMPQTESHPGTVESHDRATVWEDNFDTPGDWTATGPSGDYDEWGWSIGSTTNDWFGFDADMGTAGNFARFRNGDPTGSPAPIEDGPFTLEYNLPIDVSTATAATLEWEQYGARFIVLQEVQVSTDGGSTWMTAGDNSDIPALTSTGGDVYGKPDTRSFPLFCDLGGATTINLRLFWDGDMNGPDMNYIDYGWFVDNVRIVDGVSYDIVNDGAYHRSGVGISFEGGLEYYMIPQDQITEIEFSGDCSNNGGLDHDGANLNVDVDMGGSVYNESSPGVTLSSCASDSLFGAPAFTPASGLGDYDITYTFSGTNPDDVTTGDVATDAIEVTAYTYGRDNGVITNTINQLSGNDGEFMTIGNLMDIFNDAPIGAVDVGISGDAENVDQEIYAEIHWFDGTDFIQVAMTPEHVITAGENGGIIRLFFEDAVDVSAGDLIMVTVGHYGGPTPPAFNMCQPTIDQSVQGYYPGGGYSLADPEAIMARLWMEFSSIDEQDNSNLVLGQNVPNPFNKNSTITYTLNEAAKVSVTITDAAGKIIMDLNQGNQAAGEYKIELNGDDFSEGTYFYTFTAGETVITKRMIVTK